MAASCVKMRNESVKTRRQGMRAREILNFKEFSNPSHNYEKRLLLTRHFLVVASLLR